MDTTDLLVKPLSPCERDVLQLVAYGMTNRMIAARRGVDIQTVAKQLYWASMKLGARGRTQACLIALRRGMIDWPDNINWVSTGVDRGCYA